MSYSFHLPVFYFVLQQPIPS